MLNLWLIIKIVWMFDKMFRNGRKKFNFQLELKIHSAIFSILFARDRPSRRWLAIQTFESNLIGQKIRLDFEPSDRLLIYEKNLASWTETKTKQKNFRSLLTLSFPIWSWIVHMLHKFLSIFPSKRFWYSCCW